VCASELGGNAGESPAGRMELFTTENGVGARDCEALGVSTAQIEQAGRNENEPPRRRRGIERLAGGRAIEQAVETPAECVIRASAPEARRVYRIHRQNDQSSGGAA